MIQGLSHITFIVSDLERMAKLLTSIFEAKEVYSSTEHTFSFSKTKFFLMSETWIAIIEGNPLTERTYDHIAFKISEQDIDSYIARIKVLGLELQESRSRINGEGHSIYFYDHDNHLFELHTGTLEQRIQAYSHIDKADEN
jgi:fosfomycin resistance protein FosX